MRFRCYIMPWKDDGTDYTGEWTEVTQDVDFGAMGIISRAIDNEEYNVGVFRFSDFSLKLANETGLYGDVLEPYSIFNYKRNNSLVKITWDGNAFDPICGAAVCGVAALGGEFEAFKGYLNDESLKLNIKDQKISFRVLGIESDLDKMLVPIASISNGEALSSIILKCLNQAPLTNLITVDAGNITLGVDVNVDDVSVYEDKTVKEFLDDALLVSSSVLYISNDTIYVVDRTPTTESQHTFYGQASDSGIEDISNIGNIATGIDKVFNYWTWKDSTERAFDVNSNAKYDIRKKEISLDGVTNTTSRQNLLNGMRDEFSFPKKGFQLTSDLTYEKIELGILDKVNVDYPTVFTAPTETGVTPRYGTAIYGQSEYPRGEWSITIDPDEDYKIMGIRISPSKYLIEYKLREV